MRFISDDLVVDKTSQLPVRVLGAGLPRCATSSLQSALESSYIQRGPCMHMAHVIPHADRGDLVLVAMKETGIVRRQNLLHGLFDGFQSTTDFPGCFFVNDLMDMYPEAKIIMNTRPGGGTQWARSIQALTWARTTSYRMVTSLWKTDRNLHAIWLEWGRQSCQRHELTADELFSAKHYDLHNAWVRAEAAKRGREVLEFEPRDGWEPLCGILGEKPPPDLPFPHLNDAAEVRFVKRVLYARGIVSWLAVFGVALGTAKWLIP
ncbi:hypothetical protein N7492_001790 [Penicillium capsulatum]|uniref:NAD dependent epimerase/dehydratase n=1 Tax=Penicillium capsulatum TaxID=69766 RepID=A0A9W9IUC9_9EURO|nr:hypothetical protein N7492_001790 [Penicillium capsulatum]KAJ6129160.1 hypothetical protein N7512_001940 [Penicillium capsulatum]